MCIFSWRKYTLTISITTPIHGSPPEAMTILVMMICRYALEDVADNNRAYLVDSKIVASPGVKELLAGW